MPPNDVIGAASNEHGRESNAETSSIPVRERAEAVGGAYSATREGRRLNMLGFNSHLLDRDSAGNRNVG